MNTEEEESQRGEGKERKNNREQAKKTKRLYTRDTNSAAAAVCSFVCFRCVLSPSLPFPLLATLPPPAISGRCRRETSTSLWPRCLLLLTFGCACVQQRRATAEEGEAVSCACMPVCMCRWRHAYIFMYVYACMSVYTSSLPPLHIPCVLREREGGRARGSEEYTST